MNWGRSRCAGGLDGSGDAAGLDGGGGWLDWDSGGVLAVVVNESGALGDSVGLGAVGDGGRLRADGGKTLDGGGGVRGVLRSLGAHWVRTVGRGGGAGSIVHGVSSGGGDSRVRGSRAGLVDGGVAVCVCVGRGSKASDDSEGAHVDCWVDY